MSNEDWIKLKTWWGCDFFMPIYLQIDGYKITLINDRYRMKILVSVYVDGYMKGEYLSLDNLIGRKFYQTKSRKLYSKKAMQENLKVFGKKEGSSMQKTIQYRNFYWTSFNSLKKHIESMCNDIKLS